MIALSDGGSTATSADSLKLVLPHVRVDRELDRIGHVAALDPGQFDGT
jgi:hypothetical protein